MNKFNNVISRIEDSSRDPLEVTYNGNFYIEDFISNGVVILSFDVLKKLFNFYTDTMNNCSEYGCFLYGNRLDDGSIYLDCVSCFDFEVVDSKMVNVSSDNIRELKSNLRNNLYNCVAHVHSHPELGDLYASECYSEQDLYVYGYLQKYFQVGIDIVSFIGCLINNCNDLSFIYYDSYKKKFYSIRDIYCLVDSNLFKFNDFDSFSSKQFVKSRYCLK